MTCRIWQSTKIYFWNSADSQKIHIPVSRTLWFAQEKKKKIIQTAGGKLKSRFDKEFISILFLVEKGIYIFYVITLQCYCIVFHITRETPEFRKMIASMHKGVTSSGVAENRHLVKVYNKNE